MLQYKLTDPLHFRTPAYESRFDGYYLRIFPGAYCKFDERSPANGTHCHNCCELCIAVSGSGIYLHGKEKFKLTAGDVFVADPGVLHEICLSSNAGKSLELVYFLISVESLTTEPPATAEGKVIRSYLQQHEIQNTGQHHLFQHLQFLEGYSRYRTGSRFNSSQSVKNLILDCFISLSQKGAQECIRHDSYPPILEEAIRYIKANLFRRPPVAEIAQHASTSPRNLQHLFQKHLGKSILEFTRERLMSIAAGYLKMNFHVSEVASLLGIGDLAQFSRMFKKHYGISPKRFQQQYASTSIIESVLSK